MDHAEAINWGHSEVAVVRAEGSTAGLQLQVLWEGERNVVIDAGSADVTGPPIARLLHEALNLGGAQVCDLH